MWDVASGDLLSSHGLAVTYLNHMVPIEGVGFLGCAAEGVILIDDSSGRVELLQEGEASGPPSEGEDDPCATFAFGGGALAEFYAMDGTPTVHYVSYTGDRHAFTDHSIASVNSASWSAALTGQDRTTLVSAQGIAEVQTPEDAYVIQSLTTARYLFKSNVGYWQVTHDPAGDSAALEQLTLPPDTAAVVLTGGARDYLWLRNQGVVARSSDPVGQQLTAIPGMSSDNVVEPGLATITGGRIAAIYRSVLYVENNGGSFRARAQVGGDFRPSDCGDGGPAHFGDDGVLVGDTLRKLEQGSYVLACRLIEPGPPWKIDGSQISSGAISGELVASADQQVFGVFNPDGALEVLSLTSEEKAWRVTDVDRRPVGAAGRRAVLMHSGELLSVPVTGEPTRLKATEGKPSIWSGTPGKIGPDGLRAVTTVDGTSWLVTETTETELKGCEGGAVFVPGSDFTTSVADAERQTLVSTAWPLTETHTGQDCLTGEPASEIEAAENIHVGSYEIDEKYGSIIWRKYDGEAVKWNLSTWRRGGESVTNRSLDFPDLEMQPSFAVSRDGTRLLLCRSESGIIHSYRWAGEEWASERTYAGSLGGCAGLAWSPDQAFVISLGPSGTGFELFDAVTGQRLILDQESPSLYPHRVLTSAADGFLFVHIAGEGDDATVIEIPIGRDRLQDLLCSIHRAPACSTIK